MKASVTQSPQGTERSTNPSGGSESESLGHRVAAGSFWAAASAVVLRLGNIAIVAVIARVLDPQDFGVFALAVAVYAVVSSLSELGMSAAVLRSPSEPREIAPTVATLAIATSAVLAGLLALTAGSIARLVGSPEATEPVRILSICVLLNGTFAVPVAQLLREMRQKRLFWANIFSFVPTNGLLVALALGGSGANAFAWSRVLDTCIVGAITVASVGTKYRPTLLLKQTRGLLRLGIPLAFGNLVNYALLNADYLIVARFLTEKNVGIYMLAFNIASWPTAALGAIMNSVVVPAISQRAAARDPAAPAIVSGTRWIALVAFPIGAVTATLAHPIVTFIYGDQWTESAHILQVLAIYGVLYVFALFLANTLVAAGQTRRLLLIQILWLVTLAPTMVWSVRAGLVGIAWAHVGVALGVVLPAYWCALARNDRPSIRQVRRAVAPAVVASAVAVVVADVVSRTLPESVQGMLLAALLAALGYAAVLVVLFSRELPPQLLARLPKRLTVLRVGSRKSQPSSGPRDLGDRGSLARAELRDSTESERLV